MSGRERERRRIVGHPLIGLAKTEDGRRVCWGFDPGVATGDIPAMIVAARDGDTTTIIYAGPPIAPSEVTKHIENRAAKAL